MSKLVEKIALGTVQFGLSYGIGNTLGQTGSVEVHEILELAGKSGVNTLDTAYAYGNSEKVLGENNLEGFRIVSKFPATQREEVKDYLEQSLARLSVNGLYGYMAHNAAVLLENAGIWEQLQELKSTGRISKIGYSLYAPNELETLLSRGMTPDIVQVPYNILDQRFQPYFEQLKAMGAEIHTRSCFLQGLFFMSPEKLDNFFGEIKPILIGLAKQYPETHMRSAALLQFCLNEKYIDKVVIGVNNAAQLKQNILGASIPETLELDNYPAVANENILMPNLWPVL